MGFNFKLQTACTSIKKDDGYLSCTRALVPFNSCNGPAILRWRFCHHYSVHKNTQRTQYSICHNNRDCWHCHCNGCDHNCHYVTETFFYKETKSDNLQVSTVPMKTGTTVDIKTATESETKIVPVVAGAATEFSCKEISSTTTITKTNFSYDYVTSSVILWLEQKDIFNKVLFKTEVVPNTVDVTVTKSITHLFLCTSLCLSIRLPICPSIHLYVHLYVHLY